MDTQLYYRPGNQETAEYIERSLGRRSQYAHSQTIREGDHTSRGLYEQPIPLMTAGEISQLKDEDVVGFHRNLPPMRLTRMDWRRHSLLATRQKMSPPELNTLPAIPDIDLRYPDTHTEERLFDPDSAFN